MEQEGKKSNKRYIYLAIVILLLLLNLFLGYRYWSNHNESIKLEAERDQVDSLYSELLVELESSREELFELRGVNGTMDSLLLLRDSELDDRQKQIEKLLYRSRVTQKELGQARSMVDALKQQQKYYDAQIDSLSNTIVSLTKINNRLNSELGQEIERTEFLQKERERLTDKIKLGALFEPREILVTGIRMKSSGKELQTNKSKKTEKLKICFEIPENKIADTGEKTIYVKIINPEGTTIAVQALGSGVIELREGGETMYTMALPFSYDKKGKKICGYWSQSPEYSPGKYKAVLYQEGLEIGQKGFELN